MKEEFIYYKLKYEDANYKVCPLYYLGGTRDFGFHKQKITCNNLSWNPHTIYTEVFEEDGFYSSYNYWCPKCYSLCKTNDYYENQKKALIINLEHGNVKKIATYFNYIIIISRNKQLPKKELFESKLSIGKHTLKNYNKWVCNIKKINSEFLSLNY